MNRGFHVYLWRSGKISYSKMNIVYSDYLDFNSTLVNTDFQVEWKLGIL